MDHSLKDEGESEYINIKYIESQTYCIIFIVIDQKVNSRMINK